MGREHAGTSLRGRVTPAAPKRDGGLVKRVTDAYSADSVDSPAAASSVPSASCSGLSSA